MFYFLFFTIMNMKKFPEVKMREVAAVFACQKDDERLMMLRRVVIRSLTDYYSTLVNSKLFVIAVDPVTSAQMAGRCFEIVSQLVNEKFSLWWNVPLVFTEDTYRSFEYWQGRIEKIKEYQLLLDEFPWYHFMTRNSIKGVLQNIENEPVSLRVFLRACFYLHKDLRSVKN